jgi:toluene monooxygenase system protein D
LHDLVGPVLKAWGGRVDLVVSAIRDDNPGARLDVVDCGPNVRVQASRFLRVSRATLQWHLGRAFDIRALESMVVSSVGRMTATCEEISWDSEPEPVRLDSSPVMADGSDRPPPDHIT